MRTSATILSPRVRQQWSGNRLQYEWSVNTALLHDSDVEFVFNSDLNELTIVPFMSWIYKLPYLADTDNVLNEDIFPTELLPGNDLMTSSRMRTVRSSSRPGRGSPPGIPGSRIPRRPAARHAGIPPAMHAGIAPLQRPAAKHAGIPPAMHAGIAPPPCEQNHRHV